VAEPSLSARDLDEIRSLEESLWRRETRFDREHMENVLAPDFFEFGRSGRIYDRTATLAVPPQAIDADLPLAELRVHDLGGGTALVTYVSRVRYDNVELANRSSIWTRRLGSTEWQLRFHQGTPIVH
jgi:hypothetical protein